MAMPPTRNWASLSCLLPRRASEYTQSDSTAARDHSTTTASASFSSRMIDSWNRSPDRSSSSHHTE